MSPKNPDSPTMAELYRAILELRSEIAEFKSELRSQETKIDELRIVDREQSIRIGNNERDIKSLFDKSWQLIGALLAAIITGALSLLFFKKS